MSELPDITRCCDYDAIVHYASGEFSNRYKTVLSGKLRELPMDNPLPDWLENSFADCAYSFFETLEDLILYRVFGQISKSNSEKDRIYGARALGGFVSTEFAESVIDAKLRLALAPEWLNTKMYEEKILLPKGQKIFVGKVASVTLRTGTVLPGGADQILMPQDWPESWIIGYRRITSRQLQQEPIFIPQKPPEYDVKPNSNETVKNRLFRPTCPYCGSEKIRSLPENEQFSIIGCKGRKYTMKNACCESYCQYYW